jgi:RNA polymerase sigma-54 factor
MNLATRMRPAQVPVFRMGHLVEVLQMSGEELDEHVLRAARNNPFLVVRRRRHAALRAGGTEGPDRGEVACGPLGLQEHVLGELSGLVARGDALARLVVALVEELEPSGWLARPVAAIAQELGLGPDLVEAALDLVQARVSPAGLFARDLADCLRLQLRERGWWDAQAETVLAHLPVIARGGVEALARAAGLDAATVAEHLRRLRRLDPKPGTRFAADPVLLREPDVRVEPDGAGWRPVFATRIETEVAIVPQAARGASPGLRQALGEARALKQALDLRQNALRHVVRVLVEMQGGYFRDGPEALRPLTQAAIAERTGFHISTVSRVLNGLLIEGPNGIVEARKLCPRGAARGGEGGASKPRVLARLRALLTGECAQRPLSDRHLAERLDAEGLAVSRRVVAKYRHELGFAPASRRRPRP